MVFLLIILLYSITRRFSLKGMLRVLRIALVFFYLLPVGVEGWQVTLKGFLVV